MPDPLRVDELTAHYGDVRALHDVTLEVTPGTSLAIIGPNGSGKSTLLRAIAGIVKPTSGHIAVPDGHLPALVLQSTDVDRSLPITVRDTIAAARYASLGLLRRFGRRDRDAVERAMDRLDVTDLADRQLHDLSGGQRQRVLVAQGLAQEAGLVLLDEPVTGLDLVSRALILEVIDEEREAGRIVLLTTHNLDDARRCDQVLLLAGRPVAIGPPEEVLCEEHLRDAFGGRFIRVGDALLLDDPHHSH
ncbi:MAG: zinc ABC transporter ATP-binding protein AztA [Acidimicrobiales bacterium]|nr:zinc ABC transporter ATP-binding protein AztA [Acidimicrobiales bacterium]